MTKKMTNPMAAQRMTERIHIWHQVLLQL